MTHGPARAGAAPREARFAVVTGAGSGLGRAIALELAAAGFTLLLVGRSRAKLAETRAAAGRRDDIQLAECDLAQPDQIGPLAERACSAGRLVDVLVSAAGAIVLNDFERASLAELDLMLATNLRGPVALVQALLPSMASPAGIVMVNSLAGLRTSPHNVFYSATKHALKAVADGLRVHVAPRRVRVLSVYPALMATAMGEDVEAYYDSIDTTPRPARPKLDPAHVASEVASWILDAHDCDTDLIFDEQGAHRALS